MGTQLGDFRKGEFDSDKMAFENFAHKNSVYHPVEQLKVVDVIIFSAII